MAAWILLRCEWLAGELHSRNAEVLYPLFSLFKAPHVGERKRGTPQDDIQSEKRGLLFGPTPPVKGLPREQSCGARGAMPKPLGLKTQRAN